MPALRLLFGDRPDRDRRAERCREALASGEHDPAGVFVARDASGRLCGAAMVQAMPGALGVAWPPRGGSREIEDTLAATACDWLRASGVKVCQAFASAGQAADLAPLERAGFRHVTQLVFMRRAVGSDAPPESRPPVTFVRESPPFSEAFRAALLATQEGTLDCPELNGTRTEEELLAGFAHPGAHYAAFDPAAPETPVGVVMLAVGDEPGAVELTYLGVVPAARGRGHGDGLLAFALADAGRSGAAVLTLFVDARNEPALRLYRRRGFVETDRREVWLADLGRDASAKRC
jgi:ribosomal protein S18 acetylase RimI-like enzyme